MNNYQAEQQTANWLKQNGMDEKSFTVIELPFIQAQQVAFALMKYHAELLDDDQTAFVCSYLEDIKNKAQRKKLTATKAYRVLNIGTKINRQLFKAHKKADKSLL
jgi:hypothetical protein